ncbi:putative hydrolase of the HAD superfamily [Izhakiella capsodis]|uniref:Putative hydrolase of the HAD superfamily n=1 Tax=Izhakiella capsodis TaxID=1367852 RepID=A0A1I5A747_9GAMM|nr:glucose-1-phosphatase [Izhakiella capsodis]SFN58264.1 putative hydrolase of the HAD superfamily [Izhakiella capsodis]
MLYIFDLGNVIVDIDFNRVLGVWSDLGRVPLALLQKRFTMEESFHQHERGEIDDEQFAAKLCQQLGLALSFKQFTAGWQAIFVGVRPGVITLMNQLRQRGDRVVVLSNTNQLHCDFWRTEYPEVQQAADKIYLSQEMGMRKPEMRIYQQLIYEEGFKPEQAIFFDDNADNIEGARRLGINAVHVTDASVIPDYIASRL